MMREDRASSPPRVAILTGATSGIGLAAARTLRADGWHLVINGLDEGDRAAALAAELGCCRFVGGDVARPSTVAALMAAAREMDGPLTLLLNGAATTALVAHEDLDGLDSATWDRIMAVNLKAPWELARAAAPALRAAGGSIINIASVAGLAVDGSSIAYAVSKAGLIHLTRLLARALAPDVRVNAIAPGFIDTAWTRGWPTERRAAVIEATPLGRPGTDQDVADACRWLVDAEHCTGVVLPIDGGLLIA